jgi:ATP-dependent Clp protease protease subunit
MVNIQFRNRGPKRGEIWLYDEVGESFFGGGMSAKMFAEQLTSLGPVDTINLRINSPGGSVFDGLAIYNTLKRHPADIQVDIDGIAASIASVIAMAGNTIRIAANGMMMIHDPHGMVAGDSKDMRQTADVLDQVKGSLVDTYVLRTALPRDELVTMMASETWLTADDAVRLGFADETTEAQRIAASFDFSKFRNVPKRLVQQAVQATPARDVAAVRLAEMQAKIAGMLPA